MNNDAKIAYWISAIFFTLGLIMFGWAFSIVWNDRPYKVPQGYKLIPVEATKRQANKQGSSKQQRVNYDLGEMFIKGPKQLKAGPTTINAKNIGAAPHELVVLKTDKAADSLGSGATVPEPGKVGEAANISAGQSKPIKLNLKPGNYLMICNVPGHYAAGMYLGVKVE